MHHPRERLQPLAARPCPPTHAHRPNSPIPTPHRPFPTPKCPPTPPTGQFGRVIGYIEPLSEEEAAEAAAAAAAEGNSGGGRFVFENALVGNNIPPEFHTAIEKGFREAANAGSLIGAPVEVGPWPAVG